MANIINFLLFGMVESFLYLGIPAIVCGEISMLRIRNVHEKLPLEKVLLPIMGIILGMLPVFYIILAIY